MSNDELDLEIEQLIDHTTLLRVVRALESVCLAKAEHLRENWQEDRSAKNFERAQEALERLENRLIDLGF
jgi:hypothetical protein